MQYHLAKELDDLDNFLRVFTDQQYKESFINFAE